MTEALTPRADRPAGVARLAVHRHCTAQATVPSPLGDLLLARTAHGLAGVWFVDQKHHPGALAAAAPPDDALLREAAAQLAAYFAGTRAAFALPLDLHGTPFQRRVWQALQAIGFGTTCSYGAIAREIGAPAAVRAVGAAVGRNPAGIVVPCHRVLGAAGAMTGYAGGLDRKRALLALEGGPPAASLADASRQALLV